MLENAGKTYCIGEGCIATVPPADGEGWLSGLRRNAWKARVGLYPTGVRIPSPPSASGEISVESEVFPEVPYLVGDYPGGGKMDVVIGAEGVRRKHPAPGHRPAE